MEPGNGQPWVFGLQSCVCGPCLHLSGAGVARDMRAQRVCQARQPLSTDPEVQGKLGCLWVWDQLEPSVLRAGLSWHRSRTLSPLAGITYPCLLWASPAPSSTATCAGDISQHCPHSMIPSCVAKEVSPLLSPVLALHSCRSLLPPVHPERANGCWGLIPLQGYPRLECSQGSSCAGRVAPIAQAPCPAAAAGLSQAMERGGRWLHSQGALEGRACWERLGWRCRECSMAWQAGQWGLGTAFYSDQTRKRTKHELGMAGAAPLPACLQVPKPLTCG